MSFHIENALGRSQYVQPKDKRRAYPILFRIAAFKRIPMTRLVNQIIKDYLETHSHIQPDKTVEQLEKRN